MRRKCGTGYLWTSADDATLAREWAAGTPTRVIAAMLGTTRNAVIGRANRMCLPTHALVTKCQPIKVISMTERRREVASAAITALKGASCRWPLGSLPRAKQDKYREPASMQSSDGFHFCGDAVTHGSYCGKHAQLAYTVLPPPLVP